VSRPLIRVVLAPDLALVPRRPGFPRRHHSETLARKSHARTCIR